MILQTTFFFKNSEANLWLLFCQIKIQNQPSWVELLHAAELIKKLTSGVLRVHSKHKCPCRQLSSVAISLLCTVFYLLHHTNISIPLRNGLNLISFQIMEWDHLRIRIIFIEKSGRNICQYWSKNSSSIFTAFFLWTCFWKLNGKCFFWRLEIQRED